MKRLKAKGVELWRWLRRWRLHRGVYFDPRSRSFLEVKSCRPTGIVCGGFAKYYCDAHSNIQRVQLSYDYLQGCQKVGSIDKFKQAEYKKGYWIARGYRG